MKTDPLEEFVRANKTAFDELEPSPILWEKIEEKMPKGDQIRWQRLFIRVSAVAAIFIAGYFFSVFIHQTPADTPLAATANNEYTEMLEAKVFYTRQIEQHRTAIFELIENQPEIMEEISQEFEKMEESMQELQLDLDDEVSGEQVMEAMIQHYRLKLELLEDILLQLQASDNETQKEVHHVY